MIPYPRPELESLLQNLEARRYGDLRSAGGRDCL